MWVQEGLLWAWGQVTERPWTHSAGGSEEVKAGGREPSLALGRHLKADEKAQAVA